MTFAFQILKHQENDHEEPRENLESSRHKEEKNGPFPVEWVELQLDEVEEHRKFNCRHYDECLTKAANERWLSWTCLWCKEESR